MYYYIGLVVFWVFIVFITILLISTLFYLFEGIRIRISRNDRIMYYLGRRFDTEVLRQAYSLMDIPKLKRLIFKYRLRNIKNKR